MTALLNWRLWAAAGVAVLLAWTHWQAYRQGGASARTELAQVRQQAAEQVAQAERRQREIEAQRTRDVQEIQTNAQEQIDALAADLAASRAAADSLRSAAASAARRACPRPASASTGQGQSDTAALDLLVDVLHRHSQELVAVGEYADRLRIAGRACERAYDALAQ